MGTWMRGMRIGAGLLGIGYGIYRFSQGRRDWVTTGAFSTGVALTLGGLRQGDKQMQGGQFRRMMVTRAPRLRRTLMRMAPQVLATAGIPTKVLH